MTVIPLTSIGKVTYATMPLRVLIFIKIQTLSCFSLFLQLQCLKSLTEDKRLFCAVFNASRVSCFIFSEQGKNNWK